MAIIIGGESPRMERQVPQKAEKPVIENAAPAQPKVEEASEEPQESKPAVRKKTKNGKAKK